MTETILITGASGFLGRRIVRFLQRTSDAYLMTTSRHQESFPNHVVRDLSEITEELTQNVDTIIHFAGLGAQSHATDDEYHQSNVENTVRIAKLAMQTGVKRFIYISTADVYGDTTKSGEVLIEESAVNPKTAYAQSKLAAENALKDLCKDSEMNVIILRLALIYHIDAVNEYGDYIKRVKENRPLPLGKIHNERTFLALCNFESGLNAVLRNPNVCNETLLLADDFSLSTTEMMEGIAVAAIVPIKLFYVPKVLMKFGLLCTGKSREFDTFWRNFKISSRSAQERLNWKPASSYIVNISN